MSVVDSLAVKVAEVSAKVEGLQTDLMVKLSEVTDKLATASVQPAVCRQNTDSSRKVAVAPSQAMEHDLECRNNLVVFGLEEKNSMLETKSDVEDLFHHFVGRDVRVKDAIRLGRRGPVTGKILYVLDLYY